MDYANSRMTIRKDSGINANPKPTIAMFTSREYEIIKLIAQGLPSRAIADRLFVTIETVKSHRKNIIRKVEDLPNGRMSLLEFAIAFEKDREKSL